MLQRVSLTLRPPQSVCFDVCFCSSSKIPKDTFTVSAFGEDSCNLTLEFPSSGGWSVDEVRGFREQEARCSPRRNCAESQGNGAKEGYWERVTTSRVLQRGIGCYVHRDDSPPQLQLVVPSTSRDTFLRFHLDHAEYSLTGGCLYWYELDRLPGCVGGANRTEV